MALFSNIQTLPECGGTKKNTKHLPIKNVARDLLIVITLMFVLAGLINLIMSGGYLFNLIYCLAIGLSITLSSHFLMKWRCTDNLNWQTSLVAIFIGTAVGIVIGTVANGINPIIMIEKYPGLLLSLLVVSMICGPAISYFFYSQATISETAAALRQEEIERISYEQRLTEANFKILQAQIEPHFLFNTLSNVLSLISTRPDKAELMLSNFTAYLRASLQQTRSDRIRLEDELATVRAFLEIMAVRMENRLRYNIEVQSELLSMMVPPLLIQPLVENAVEHGIDPKPEGGSVTIKASSSEGMLMIEIGDSGDGISSSSPMGVGMSNIRERLNLLYNGEASFQVLPNSPNGTTVRLTIPMTTGGKQ
jgi:sensor histidine kinase YesM